VKYPLRYPGIRRGMHSPDERVYRANEQRPCAMCGELTDWTDPALRVPVCSEECDRALASRRKPDPSI
jgi:hypothetical protein